MLLTLREAAEQTGKSKQTIHYAIKKGKISATKNSNGELQIQAVDLFNYYKPVKKADVKETSKESSKSDDLLREKIHFLTERVEDLKTQRDDLRSERDKWQQQAERLALTYKPQKSPEKPVETQPDLSAAKPYQNERRVFSESLRPIEWVFVAFMSLLILGLMLFALRVN